jgi:predicted NAD/FAD-binding protein
VIEGGSSAYIAPLTASFRERIRLNCPVTGRTRCRGRGYPQPAGSERFDKVVFACHSDQALQLLAAPSEAEQSILGALPYADNDVVLHTDTRLLPPKTGVGQLELPSGGAGHTQAAVTYDMNILQGIQSDTTFCVSLNQSAAINPFKVLAKYTYAHPQYSLAAVAAQARWEELTGSSTPITAAPTGPTVSMRTAWSAHCAWPRLWRKL